MLVAGAALSLLAPIGAQASNINLEDMNSYSRSKKSKRFKHNFSNLQPSDWAFQSIKKIVKARSCNLSMPNEAITRHEAASILSACLSDVAEITPTERRLINEFSPEIATLNDPNQVLESNLNGLEAGGFSDTTTFGGSAVFAIGGVDGGDTMGDSDSVQTLYTYTIDLNSSFTGDDNLYVRLRTGANGASLGNKPAVYHPDRYSGTTDSLAVDKIWYQFPLGENFTGWIGPKIENYYMYAAPVSLYKPGSQKAFKLGSASAAFGASTATGVGLKYESDNGWAISSNVVSKDAELTGGFLTNADTFKWDTMLAYTQDQYHISLTKSEQYNGWNSFSYYATNGALQINTGHDGVNAANATAWALRSYWRPLESGTAIPEISVGFDVIDMRNNNDNFSEATSTFIGFGWKDIIRADDKIGLAYGTLLKPTSMGGSGVLPTLDPSLWEAYYSFMLNDSVQITPAVFGGNDLLSDSADDIFGAMLTTKFKF